MASTKKLVLSSGQKNVYPKVPLLREILKKFTPLPNEAVVLGVAHDDLPVLINAKDSSTPNIIVWDKLARQGLLILKVIAEYVFKIRDAVSFKRTPTQIEFVVLTLHSEDWGELNEYGMGVRGKTSCIGILPFYSDLANKVIHGLARWIHEPHSSSKHPVIILIDGLDNVDKLDIDFKTDFRYILNMGRKKHVYVIATAHKNKYAQVRDWLDGFGAEIYGRDILTSFQMEEGKNTIVFFTPQTEIL